MSTVPHRRMTIRDVAREANVTPAVVSYVLNGREKQYRISADTAQRVRAVCRRLHYRPSAAAKGLALRSSANIGLTVYTLRYFQEHYFSQILAGVATALSRYTYNLILCTSGPSTAEENDHLSYRSRIDDKSVDGLIVVDQLFPPEVIDELVKKNFPLVLIDLEAPGVATQNELVDAETAMRLAVSHLLKRGRRRLAFFGDDPNLFWLNRFQYNAFERVMHEFDLNVTGAYDFSQAPRSLFEPGRQAALDRLLETQPPPDALIVGNPGLVAMAYHSARRLGLEIPRDLAVVSLRDADLCLQLHPEITAVDQKTLQVAENAALRMIRLLKPEAGAEPTLIEPELRVRESS